MRLRYPSQLSKEASDLFTFGTEIAEDGRNPGMESKILMCGAASGLSAMVVISGLLWRKKADTSLKFKLSLTSGVTLLFTQSGLVQGYN